MRSFSVLAIAAACLGLIGCNTHTGISPKETVIKKSADRDFHFAGTWLPVGQATKSAANQPDLSTFRLEIEGTDEYMATVRGTVENQEHQVKATFRAVEISQDDPHAIVEVHIDDGLFFKGHYLSVAAVKGDYLYLWSIDGRKLAEHLYNSGHTAVIEHFSYHSTVRCPPEKLLDTIRQHAAEVLGDVQVFQRHPKA